MAPNISNNPGARSVPVGIGYPKSIRVPRMFSSVSIIILQVPILLAKYAYNSELY